MSRYDKLDQLGAATPLPASPDEAELERVPNPCDEPYMVRLVAPEFTSICPVTGQPDFAHLVVDYCPDEWIVESKAFKLFLGSFRNHGDFHEACVNRIANDLVELLQPFQLTVTGQFTPRGGISLWPKAVYSRPS